MALPRERTNRLTVHPGERLVAVSEIVNDETIVHYYVESTDFAIPTGPQQKPGVPLADFKQFAGVLSDVGWEDMEAGLEEIRRSSKPSAPLDDV